MNENSKEKVSIYEIGYLVVPSISEESIPGEVEALKGILAGAGVVMIAEETPHKISLAYTIRKKTVSGSYDKYDKAFFGWFKFEAEPDKIESVKKAFETRLTILRMLLMTTVREDTYLGKRAPAMEGDLVSKKSSGEELGKMVEEKKETPVVSIEEIDKSIDEMVKQI